MAVTYRALLPRVLHARTGLSTHGVGVGPLFCLDFWDRDRASTTRGGGHMRVVSSAPLNVRRAFERLSNKHEKS